MKALFHSIAALSIATLALPAVSAAAAPSPYFGRWTINEAKPVFTAKGRLYRTIDLAPCGRDFCAVSVGDKGQCGAVLFRLPIRHATSDATIHGRARWGTQTKNVQLSTCETDPNDWPGGREIDLYVGDGYDFGDRSDNMPKFHGEYKRIGNARCSAR